MKKIAEGAVPSPNIWKFPHIYEIENAAVDPDRVIEETMRAERPWTGATVLDIGCGTGYHLPRFADEASRVIGVEPHGDLVGGARRRVRHLSHVSAVVTTPVPSAFVSNRASPTRAAAFVQMRAGWTRPVTAYPNFTSGSCTVWPPSSATPASRRT